VSENRVFSRIFGPKRDEVTGGWRKMHKYNYNDQVKEDERCRACNTNTGEVECV
jgi:hypothetical protein